MFKGQKGATTDGLYLKLDGVSGLQTVLETGMSGGSVDPEAPVSADPSDPLAVTTIGVERDGFRGPWLTVTVGMANAAATVSWAGIYAHNCGSGCTNWQ